MTRAGLAGEKAWDHNQTKIYGPDHNNERKKEKRDACSQCPGTRTAALLPKMSLLTLQISIKHAVLHLFACNLHANDLIPQCIQSPKQLLVLAFLPILPLVLY